MSNRSVGMSVAAFVLLAIVTSSRAQTASLPSFFRGVGVPTGTQPASECRAVSADGHVVYGVENYSYTNRRFFLTPAFAGRRRLLGPNPVAAGPVVPTAIVASNGGTVMLAKWVEMFWGGRPLSGIADPTGAWIMITDSLEPAFGGLEAQAVSPDGSLIAFNATDNVTGRRHGFVMINGVVTDVGSLLPVTGVVDVRVSDVAHFRHMCAGVVYVNFGVGQPFVADLRSMTGRVLPNPFGGLFEAQEVQISGDGLTTAVTSVDYVFTTPPLVGAYAEFSNGITTTVTTLVAPNPTGGGAVCLNETGQVIGGADPALGATLWTDGGAKSAVAMLGAAGVATPGFSSLSIVNDMSSADTIVGLGLNTQNLFEGWIAAVPLKRVRSDFNRNRAPAQDPTDISEYLLAFASGNLAADWDYNGILNATDQSLFAIDWVNGR